MKASHFPREYFGKQKHMKTISLRGRTLNADLFRSLTVIDRGPKTAPAYSVRAVFGSTVLHLDAFSDRHEMREYVQSILTQLQLECEINVISVGNSIFRADAVVQVMAAVHEDDSWYLGVTMDDGINYEFRCDEAVAQQLCAGITTILEDNGSAEPVPNWIRIV